MRSGAIYGRVSTVQQQEEGTSIETQVAACLDLANKIGCAVDEAHIWREQGSGGNPMRPKFQELMRCIGENVFTDVFIYAPDRAARDPVELLIFCRLCSSADAQLHFVVGPQGNDDYADLIRFVAGFAGKQERAMIAERTARGKLATARAGRLPNGVGIGKYGYDYDPMTKVRTINEAEANVVRRIFREVASGKSVWGVTKKLNEEGIPTKGGKKWHPLSITRILKSATYFGLDYYRRTRTFTNEEGKRKTVERPKEEWIEIRGFTPPIVSERLYLTVEELLGRPSAQKVAPRRPYLLTGFMLCGTCGGSVSGASKMGRARHYRCRATSSTTFTAATCHESYFNADKIEGLVWAEVVRALKNPLVLIRDLQQYLDQGDGNIGEEIARLQREIAHLRRQEANFAALAKNPDFDLEIVAAQNAPVLALRRELQRTLKTLEDQQGLRDEAADVQAQFAEYCQTIAKNIDAVIDFDRRRQTLAAFGVKVWATKRDAKIVAYVSPEVTTIAQTSASLRECTCSPRCL